MAKLDEKIAEVGAYTIFRKPEAPYYEIVGPAVENSPLSYTIIRTTLKILKKIELEIAADMQRKR
jgi:hypothetical protein